MSDLIESTNDTIASTPWLSIIVPCYNCSDTIERLLDSIVVQEDPNLEVILCDDYSTDNFMEKVEKYTPLLNIKYLKTKPRDTHCPGNTRFDGWHAATGEWITFIDHDDLFEPDAFANVKECLRVTGESHVLFTSFRGFFWETQQYGQEYDGVTWMHGKFYNRQWLIDEGIDFKENLYSHEDLYFNGRVFATLLGQEIAYQRFSAYTYKWVYKQDSLSRQYENMEHSFVETYFDDYIFAASEPWFANFKKSPHLKPVFFRQLCSILLYCYFYYQNMIWSIGVERMLPGRLEMIQYLLYKILCEFKATKEEIITEIYSMPDHYNKTKLEAQSGSCPFVEFTSFKDFILSL